MLFIRSHAPTVRGAIPVRLVDVYKQRRKNILETQKPSNKFLTSLHMPGSIDFPGSIDHSIDFDSARVSDKRNFHVR